MSLAKEKEKEKNMVPDTMKGDIAWCARNKDTSTCFTAPSYQNISPEVVISSKSPEKYVNPASQLLMIPQSAFINGQGITMTGCARKARLTSYFARIVRNTKNHRIG